MFQLSVLPFGKYQCYTVAHAGVGFSIVPDLGANVIDIQFNGRAILDGYLTPEALEEGKWGKSTVLFPFPNRLRDGQYQWEGRRYQFPVNNAATGNAIHGFVRAHAFEVIHVLLKPDRASIACQLVYEGSYAHYPFPFTLNLTYTISRDGVFSVQASCRNRHIRPIPIGFGWHPYFKLGPRADACALSLPACERVDIDDRMIPTGVRSAYTAFDQQREIGETMLDNCFLSLSKGMYKARLRGEAGKIDLHASAAKFPYFQVFTPPHRESIALEPMSCNVDAFNNRDGLVALAPGALWRGDFRFKYSL
jgi:aldose 1-epimerase